MGRFTEGEATVLQEANSESVAGGSGVLGQWSSMTAGLAVSGATLERSPHTSVVPRRPSHWLRASFLEPEHMAVQRVTFLVQASPAILLEGFNETAHPHTP